MKINQEKVAHTRKKVDLYSKGEDYVIFYNQFDPQEPIVPVRTQETVLE